VVPAGAGISVMKARTRWLVLAAASVAVLTILPAATVLLSAPAGPPRGQLSLVLASENLNAPPTGHILFGSPLPVAEILPTSSSTQGATLGLNHLLEIAPNASDPEHPTVVAEAAPETLASFNGTPYNGTPNYYNLIATLPVYPAKTALWTSGTTILPTSAVSQQAILDVNYSVATGSDRSPGVLLSWAVSGWPWVNPANDELALEYVVQVNSGTGFQTCSGPPSTNAPDAKCATEPLDQGQAVWSSTLTALKGNGPSGSEAWVSWSSTVGGSGTQARPVSAGAYYVEPGISALAIAAPDGGASSVMGSTLFLLSPGAVASLVTTIVGDLPAYGGAAALSAAVAVTGIFLSRRRDRALAEELEK
jgi:hypothetical protein